MRLRKILVTGAAGFIGSSISQILVDSENQVIGIDNLSPANIQYKKYNLSNLLKKKNFIFHNLDILKKEEVFEIFNKYLPDTILHFAALTGIRTSLLHPKLYRKVNVNGTQIVYEAAVKSKAKSFIFSSSSSVYGNSDQVPVKEKYPLWPLSPYAKSKVEAEKLLSKHHSIYKLPTTIFRFFSVYGPRGRPDMAPYLFTQAAFSQKTIDQLGDGKSARDYTYIDDVCLAIQKSLDKNFFWEIINIGNSTPVKLSRLLKIIEKWTKKRIKKRILPSHQAESLITYADIGKAKKLLSWAPTVKFEKGMQLFVEWYKRNRL